VDFGVLGHVDGVQIYRDAAPRHVPGAELDVSGLTEVPRGLSFIPMAARLARRWTPMWRRAPEASAPPVWRQASPPVTSGKR